MALTDLSGGGVAVDPVAEQRQLAARLCTSLEQFVSPFLLPCARRTFTMETVAMQGSDDGGGAPLTQMGSVAVQASTAPQLVANVLAKLTSRVYLAANCPGTPEEIRAQFRKYGRVRVSKHDELCMKNEEFCMKNEELCIKNEELCIQNDGFCSGPTYARARESGGSSMITSSLRSGGGLRMKVSHLLIYQAPACFTDLSSAGMFYRSAHNH